MTKLNIDLKGNINKKAFSFSWEGFFMGLMWVLETGGIQDERKEGST